MKETTLKEKRQKDKGSEPLKKTSSEIWTCPECGEEFRLTHIEFLKTRKKKHQMERR
jgi:ribosomal protein L37AE/L43A